MAPESNQARLDQAAALVLENTLRELRQVYENLEATHAKCSQLNDENRAMKMAASTLVEPHEWKATVAKALKDLQGPDKK